MTINRIFINIKDKQKAIDIICSGINEYINGGIDNYLKDYECSRTSDKINTTELYADDRKIAFITKIHNEDELIELRVDGRGQKKNKIEVLWSAEYFASDDIISDS